MSDVVRVPEETLTSMTGSAAEVIHHLCEGDCHGFGDVLQWCETRGDCTYAIVCPGCATQFVLDEDDVDALERWSNAYGSQHVCGVRAPA